MLDLDEVRATMDANGVTVGNELDRHGYSALPHPSRKQMAAYLELHIEQGPVLEQQGKTIGVVTGAQGIRWYDLTLTGQEVHAGPFPMAMRRDPVAVLPDLIRGILEIGQVDERARATIGQLTARPGSRNVVPGQVDLTVDLRHPDEAILTAMHEGLERLLEGLDKAHSGIDMASRLIWHSPVVAFDADLVDAVRVGTQAHRLSHMDIVSGAGHDALMVARRVPTTMIFIPCRDGLSHNEAEHAEPEHVAAGANVLLTAVLERLGLS